MTNTFYHAWYHWALYKESRHLRGTPGRPTYSQDSSWEAEPLQQTPSAQRIMCSPCQDTAELCCYIHTGLCLGHTDREMCDYYTVVEYCYAHHISLWSLLCRHRYPQVYTNQIGLVPSHHNPVPENDNTDSIIRATTTNRQSGNQGYPTG